MEPEIQNVCQLCGRTVLRLTRHHLRPKEHGGVETALLCAGCHRQVHALFTNRTLANQYDSLDKLREDPAIRTYVAWAGRQSDCRFAVRRSRARK
jgi:5-methylcytosine-specific restriction protein A